MSSRPSDWSSLGWSCDPVPGEPSVVRAAAQRYAETAEAIKTAQRSLSSLSYQSRGEAVSKLQDRARELSGEVGNAYSRCHGAGEAMAEYAPKLEEVQKDSLAALREADPAYSDLNTARAKVNLCANAHNGTLDPEKRAELRRQWSTHRSEYLDAQSRLQAARDKLNQAISARDAAARTAEARLEDVQSHSPLKDGLWDKFKEALRGLAKAAEELRKVLEVVSTALTIVTIIVGVVCPPVGSALLLVGLAVSAGIAACKLVENGSRCADGEMSVTEFALRTAVDVGMLAVEAAGVAKARSALGATRGALESTAKTPLTEGTRRAIAQSAADKAKSIHEAGLNPIEKTFDLLNDARSVGGKIIPGARVGQSRLGAMTMDLAHEGAKYATKKLTKFGVDSAVDRVTSSNRVGVDENDESGQESRGTD